MRQFKFELGNRSLFYGFPWLEIIFVLLAQVHEVLREGENDWCHHGWMSVLSEPAFG